MSHLAACTTYRTAQKPRPCGPDPCARKPGLIWPKGIKSPFWANQRIQDRRAFKRSPFEERCVTFRSASKEVNSLCPIDQNGAPAEGFAIRVNSVQCGDCTAADTPTRLRIAPTEPAIQEILLVGMPKAGIVGDVFELGPIVEGEDYVLSVPDLRLWNDPKVERRLLVSVEAGPGQAEEFLYPGPCIDGRAITYTFALDSADRCPLPAAHPY